MWTPELPFFQWPSGDIRNCWPKWSTSTGTLRFLVGYVLPFTGVPVMFILGITVYFWLLCDRILIRLLEKWCGYLLELRLTPFKIDFNKCRSKWFWDIWETYRQIGFMGMGSSWILNKWPVLSADGQSFNDPLFLHIISLAHQNA